MFVGADVLQTFSGVGVFRLIMAYLFTIYVNCVKIQTIVKKRD
jgi:hypothetical protein